MDFLRNTWYVAAHAQEVTTGALFSGKLYKIPAADG
jgi:hypothetical protein